MPSYASAGVDSERFTRVEEQVREPARYREVAETKVGQVHLAARQAGFPLKCSLERI